MFKKEKKEKIGNFKVNAIFNAIYQVLILIVPLITTPYISTIFSSNIIGSYSFGFSTVQYFVLAADFGFTLYGTTVIAKIRGNKKDETFGFWSVFYCKLLLDFLILIFYFSFLFSGMFQNGNFPLNDKTIFLLFSLDIFASLFDTTFLFQGKEKFLNLCIRNLIVKIFSTILIFVFVKKPEDYRIYVLIMSLSYFFSGFITFISMPFLVGKPVKVSRTTLSTHYKKSLFFFIPSVATTIYTIASKSILGAIQGDSSQNGFYEQANKIVDIIISLVNSVNTIMTARMAYLYANGKTGEINQKINKIFQVYSVVAIPAFFGLIAVNDFLTLGFLGANFDGSINLIYILSLKIIIVPISGILGSIYYIPNNELKKRMIFLVCGAIFNLGVNTLFVYFLSSVGAAISTILTEFLVTSLYVIGCYGKINYRELFKDLLRTVPASLIMFIVIFFSKSGLYSGIGSFLNLINLSSIRATYFVSAVLLALIGCFIYLILLIILKEPFIWSFVNEFKNRISKKKEI